MSSELVPDLWGGMSPASPVAPEPVDAAAQARKREHARWTAGNQLVVEVGPGPEGATCKPCLFLMRLDHHGHNYYKCAMRGQPTHGTATDHRQKWPACARITPRPDGYDGEPRDQETITYLIALAKGDTKEAPEVALPRLDAERQARFSEFVRQERETLRQTTERLRQASERRRKR